MPEAEDVLLHAAHRAAHATAALWRRLDAAHGAGARRPDGVSLGDEERRLALWLEATVGRSFALVRCDPLPRATGLGGWLARHLGDRPPWADAGVAPAFTDGERLFLPRHLAPDPDRETARVRLLLAALGQARRATGGALRAMPAEPAARDLYWALDGALTDAWLAERWPGLARALGDERARALRARPAARELRPREWPVEALVRSLLSGDAAAGAGLVRRLARDHVAPAELARLARALAANVGVASGPVYRGVAPVVHWGVPRGDLVAAPAAAAPTPPDDGLAARGRSLALPRRVETRAAEPDELEGRSGPFALAFGDPELSVQDPAGVKRPEDQGDEPELETLAEALAELDVAARTRAPGPVRDALLQDEPPRGGARAAESARAADGPGLVLRFPEWDERRGGYLAGHCRVTVSDVRGRDAGFAERSFRERPELRGRIRRRFEALRPRRDRSPRELEGDELDVDAFVGELADARAGVSPAGRIYSQARPRRRDVAVTLLLDVSGSTDAQVDGALRVIDVEKAAALAFCEALAALGDRHAVYAFSGQGAEGVRVRCVKRFGERDAAEVRARIGALEPESFTRLGAALRFATSQLVREHARHRLLLVLSDGKPYDDDEYAGVHGTADVRQAVAEAELAGIRPFCVTVDREGSRYLGGLFGAGRYTVISNLRQLPDRLPELYRRLTAAA